MTGAKMLMLCIRNKAAGKGAFESAGRTNETAAAAAEKQRGTEKTTNSSSLHYGNSNE